MLIDLFLIALLFLAGVKGYKRGLIVGVFSFVAVVVGVAAAVKLSVVAADAMRHYTDIAGGWIPLLSFLAVFIAVVLLIRLAANAIEEAVKIVTLGWANKLGGVLLYMMLYTIVYSVVLFYLYSMGVFSKATTTDSFTFAFLQQIGPWVIEGMASLFPLFKDMFSALQKFFAELNANLSGS
ncbi:MAG: CvpA family protein [Chitinophagia bacterium]|nr:CvpA family protein [Chitinophagia bacterium]